MHRSRPLLAAAAVIVTALLAGCGGSSGVSAGQYVKSICSAVAPFEKNLAAHAASLTAIKPANPTQAKTVLHNFYSEAVSDTDQALSRVKAAGVPNVKNGKSISSGAVSGFTALKKAFSQAATQANSLPTNDPKAFAPAVQATGQAVSSSANGVRSSLSQIDNSSELRKAAAKEPACKTLGATG